LGEHADEAGEFGHLAAAGVADLQAGRSADRPLSVIMIWVNTHLVKWRVLIWCSIGISVAAAAVLVVVIVVSGMDEATVWAGVIVGFCELAALVLGTTAWASERQAAAVSREADSAEPGAALHEGEGGGEPRVGGGGKYTVDAREAEAVQIGDGNTQHNDFRRASPEG
jgi:hypothetical protein